MSDKLVLISKIKMPIYAIRTTANKERNVASKLADKVEKDKLKIGAIVVLGLKGYIFVEGDRQEIEKVYKGIAHARGIVEGEASIAEMERFLAPQPVVTNLQENYIIEVTSGPFKGEKAKIVRVDKTKNEVTIELLEATVPIPITVPAESVRVIEKTGEEKKEGEETGKERKEEQ